MGPLLIVVFLAIFATIQPAFVDFPSLALTVGGSLAVVMFSYSPAQLREVVRLNRTLLLERSVGVREFADELSRLTQLYRIEGLRGLERVERTLSDSFLAQAVGMLIDLQREANISDTLARDLSDAASWHELSGQVLLLMHRIFPAFGLIGTLVGMVLLLRDLYTQDVQSLPAALSLAVLTTLYGAVFANVLIAPLAARVNAAAAAKELRMQMTIRWALALARNEAGASAKPKATGPRRAAAMPQLSDRREWQLIPASSH
jgi:chemotaxis protein MotA